MDEEWPESQDSTFSQTIVAARDERSEVDTFCGEPRKLGGVKQKPGTARQRIRVDHETSS